MAQRIQLRRDTAANWTSVNPTLAQGEYGYETDTNKFKVGDGSTAWNSLNYNSTAIVVSSNTTAINDKEYNVVASATFTDPSPVEGKGFTVFVRNGTATVGGTAYATAGTVIRRIYHSGAWATYISSTSFISAVALTDGANITLTSGLHTLTTDEATITFADSFADVFLLVEVTLNVTSATWTFSAGTSLGSFNGTPTGNNTITVTGIVGDRVHLSRAKVGTNYSYNAFNYGQ
jgi:hypothetical protein